MRLLPPAAIWWDRVLVAVYGLEQTGGRDQSGVTAAEVGVALDEGAQAVSPAFARFRKDGHVVHRGGRPTHWSLTDEGRRTAERLLELYDTIDGSAVCELAHAAVPDHATVAESVLEEIRLPWNRLAFELRWLFRNRWALGEPSTVQVAFTAGAIKGAVVALSLLPGVAAENADRGEIDGTSMREAAFRTIPSHAASAEQILSGFEIQWETLASEISRCDQSGDDADERQAQRDGLIEGAVVALAAVADQARRNAAQPQA